MTKKILKIDVEKRSGSKKKIIEKLRLKFPRVQRDLGEYIIIPPDDSKNYRPLSGIRRVTASKTPEDNGYHEVGSAYFYQFFGRCLDHVLYRSLKEVYDLPDPITVQIFKEEVVGPQHTSATGRPEEWSYLLRGENGSVIEITKTFGDEHPKFILWSSHKEKNAEVQRKCSEGLRDFCALFFRLVAIVDSNYSVEDEQKKIKRLFGTSIPDLVTNLYNQNLQAGKAVLELAGEWQSDYLQSSLDLRAEGNFVKAFEPYSKRNTLYISAIVFFLMALEGFVNLLYEFLLKPEFNNKDFERAVYRNDFDLRILHLPLYCNGFGPQRITPEDMIYKNWLNLRHFRNNLLHSNITEENVSKATFEDWFFFQYDPLSHIAQIRKRKMHTQHLYIGKDEAAGVQKTVEEIVNGIIDKMSEKERAWIRSWVNLPLILWAPGIEAEGADWLKKNIFDLKTHT